MQNCKLGHTNAENEYEEEGVEYGDFQNSNDLLLEVVMSVT